MSENSTNKRQLITPKQGVVVSDVRDKTCTVAVEYREVHPIYGKSVGRHAKFHVHDEQNQARKGDKVEIASCRPYSKTKNYRLVRIIEKAVAQAGA